MPIMTLVFEFLIFHTLAEKLLYEPRYEVSREDEEILPIYNSADEYRPLSMERLYMINELIERG